MDWENSIEIFIPEKKKKKQLTSLQIIKCLNKIYLHFIIRNVILLFAMFPVSNYDNVTEDIFLNKGEDCNNQNYEIMKQGQ